MKFTDSDTSDAILARSGVTDPADVRRNGILMLVAGAIFTLVHFGIYVWDEGISPHSTTLSDIFASLLGPILLALGFVVQGISLILKSKKLPSLSELGSNKIQNTVASAPDPQK